MPTREVTCFIAVCGDCGKEHEDDYTPHFPSSGEAVDDAVNCCDWWTDDKVLLCSDCRLKPHQFVESKFYADHCDRCDNPDDEHESLGGDPR